VTRRVFRCGRGRGAVRRGKSRKILDRHVVRQTGPGFGESVPIVLQRCSHAAKRLQEFLGQSQRVHGKTAVPVSQSSGAARRRETGTFRTPNGTQPISSIF